MNSLCTNNYLAAPENVQRMGALDKKIVDYYLIIIIEKIFV